MSITAIRGNAPKTESTTSGTQLNMENFLALLTVQLATQNPLEPMNDRDFFAQLAQLGQVQGTEQMTRQLNNLGSMLLEGFGALGVSMQDLGMYQASSMVGKQVTATRKVDGQTEPVEFTGKVEKVTFKDGAMTLSVRDSASGELYEVAMDKVTSISNG